MPPRRSNSILPVFSRAAVNTYFKVFGVTRSSGYYGLCLDIFTISTVWRRRWKASRQLLTFATFISLPNKKVSSKDHRADRRINKFLYSYRLHELCVPCLYRGSCLEVFVIYIMTSRFYFSSSSISVTIFRRT